jgi:hypothetical protein
MHVVEMSVMQIIQVPVMSDADVAAIRAMPVRMVAVAGAGTSAHVFHLPGQDSGGWQRSFHRMIDRTAHEQHDMLVSQRIEDVFRIAPSPEKPGAI